MKSRNLLILLPSLLPLKINNNHFVRRMSLALYEHLSIHWVVLTISGERASASAQKRTTSILRHRIGWWKYKTVHSLVRPLFCHHRSGLSSSILKAAYKVHTFPWLLSVPDKNIEGKVITIIMKIMRISSSSKGDCDLHPHMDSWRMGSGNLWWRKLKLFFFEREGYRVDWKKDRKNSSSTNPIWVIISTHLGCAVMLYFARHESAD